MPKVALLDQNHALYTISHKLSLVLFEGPLVDGNVLEHDHLLRFGQYTSIIGVF